MNKTIPAFVFLPLILLGLTGCDNAQVSQPSSYQAPKIEVQVPAPDPNKDESGAIFSDPEHMETRSKEFAPEI